MTTPASQNPFRVERVHALGYRLEDESWDEVINRLRGAQWRGAILGPHGTGKTTMMLELADQLRYRGEDVVELFKNTSHGRSLPGDWNAALRKIQERTVVLADGYEVLHAAARWRVRRQAKRLVVTAHQVCALQTLYRCESRADVLGWVVRSLSNQTFSQQRSETMLARHGGNMREVIRALYDASAQGAL